MKICAFCPREANSPEHIFSDWMIDLLPKGQYYLCNERIVSRDEYVNYPKRKIKFTARAVCTPCNTGWMSNIEDALKEIIGGVLVDDFGRAVLFTPEAQKVIAAFAFKTLVLANHKDLGRKRPFFTREQRFLFRRSLVIPDGVSVFMATREHIAGKYYGFWKSISGESQNKGASYNWSAYGVTWNFKNIVLQAVATKWKSHARRNSFPPITFPEVDDWKPASVRIWPLSGGNLYWPPEYCLGAKSLFDYRDRFENIGVKFSLF